MPNASGGMYIMPSIVVVGYTLSLAVSTYRREHHLNDINNIIALDYYQVFFTTEK